MIPQDAVGLLSDNNDLPDVYRYSSAEWNVAQVVVADDFHMKITQSVAHDQVKNTYLGVIVSNDRRIVYWKNNTKPLP